MSLSSRESELAQIREALAQWNSEFFLTIKERRNLTDKVLGSQVSAGRYSHYDPEQEKELFTLFQPQLKACSIKELLAFSLILEDHAMAMAPGSYPTWSQMTHVTSPKRELYEMVNPLMLKLSRPDFFARVTLSVEFSFLKDF
jgi:chorismate mutase